MLLPKNKLIKPYLSSFSSKFKNFFKSNEKLKSSVFDEKYLMQKPLKFYVSILIGVFLLTSSLTYFGLKISNVFVNSDSNNPSPAKAERSLQMSLASDSDSVVSILLLGYGGQGHDGGSLSDVLMLARIDYKNKKVAFISIPRDLWVALPIRSDLTESYKINMAHAIGLDDRTYGYKEPLYRGEAGGGNMAKFAVERVTGMPVDYFISVSFDGFREAIDAIEGLEVNVPVTFDDNYYPVKGKENETCDFTNAEIDLFHRQYSGFELEKQFTCRYEHLHFEKGTNHMDGESALKFVRSRHSDTHGGDFARSARQQAVLIALKDKLISLDALTHIDEFVDKFSSMVRTDANLESIRALVDLLGNPDQYQITNINLSTDNVLVASTSSQGAYVLLPKSGENNWSEVQKFIAENL